MMEPWDRAITARALLAIDPAGLGGMTLRARSGPARTAFVNHIPKPHTRLHPAMATDDLIGGIDLASTLESGALKRKRGLLYRDTKLLVLGMAERADPQFTTLLAQRLDMDDSPCLVALDEGASEDETLPASLADRLAFHVNFDGLAISGIGVGSNASETQTYGGVQFPETLHHDLVTLAARLGIDSLRAPIFALRAAKAHALFRGDSTVRSEDIEIAVALVFAHRATRLPQEAADDTPPAPEPEAQSEEQQENTTELPQEILLEAIKAALPSDILANLANGTAKRGKGAGSGKRRVGNRRGRPMPARDTPAKSGSRIDLMATLRAGIPLQTLRKRAQPDHAGAIIRPSDLRAKRYQEHSDRLLIFTVDASGSAALARLGEAKGAVELLLAQAYARRDHVALIAFRGTNAEVLLHPTRSLVQTKRQLASLPGGGGTPLATGLSTAIDMADHAKRKGLTPTVVLLTDGRSNIALDGTPNRAQAASDATAMADTLSLQGADAVVIDTGNRPERSLADLSKRLGGAYVALPRANAQRLSAAVATHLGQ
jgi:magnesium chelatase subunit D